MTPQSKCILILFALILMPLCIKGQNLIIDPGFEEVELVLEDGDTVYSYKYWTSLLKFKKLSPRGLPIFSIYSKRHKEDRSFHYWVPYQGNSYFFSHIVYFRNLYQTKLLDELIPENIYKINFKYKVGADGFSKEKIESSINNKIGVLLTNKDMSDSSGLSIMKNQNLELNPQIKIKSYNADSINTWTDFTYYFKADKKYQYFIIGNFTRLIEGHELRYHPITGVSYKIDQVSIELVPDTVNHNFISADLEIVNADQNAVINDLTFSGGAVDSVLNYYNHIHKAEDFIIKNLLDSAIIEYHKAFTWKTSFFGDRRNAKRAIQVSPLFDSLLIRDYLPSKQNLTTRNKILTAQIDSVFILDQLCRNNNLDISKQDSFNFVFLQNVIKNEVISEGTIGVNGMTRLNIILLHLSRYKYFAAMATELHEEAIVGNFDNRQFAELVDSYYENNITFDKTNTYYSSNSFFALYTKFITPIIPKDRLELVNNNRARIGLGNLQFQYQKQFYNFKYGYQDFEFYQIFTYFPFEIESENWMNAAHLSGEHKMEEELNSKYGNVVIWRR